VPAPLQVIGLVAGGERGEKEFVVRRISGYGLLDDARGARGKSAAGEASVSTAANLPS